MTGSIFGRAARLSAAALLVLGVGSTALAEYEANTGVPYSAYEKLDSLPALNGLYSWSVINDRTVLIWATPYDPYLVDLVHRVPAHGLKFAHVIGVTSYGSRVSARVDWLLVDGLRYRIDSIYKLTREQAEELKQPS